MCIRRGCLSGVIIFLLVSSFARAEGDQPRLVLQIIRLKPGETKALELALPDPNADFNASNKNMRDLMDIHLLPKKWETDKPKRVEGDARFDPVKVGEGLKLVWEKDKAGISVQAGKEAKPATVDLRIASRRWLRLPSHDESRRRSCLRLVLCQSEWPLV